MNYEIVQRSAAFARGYYESVREQAQRTQQ